MATTHEPGEGSSVEDREFEYTSAGTVATDEPEPTEETPAPVTLHPVSPSDAPFSVDVVPPGWSRFPTEEEVTYLNAKYGTVVPTQE